MGFFKAINAPQVLSILAIFLICTKVSGQSDSLQTKYNELMGSSETYQKYKVIVKEDLDDFWIAAQDTVGDYQRRLRIEQSQVVGLKRELSDAEEQIGKLDEQLKTLSDQVGSITFLGILFSKATYHALVWSLILLLIAGVGVIYATSLRARLVTKSTAADYKSLLSEYEEYKERARAREVKVKRELQTASNNLEEFKRTMRK